MKFLLIFLSFLLLSGCSAPIPEETTEASPPVETAPPPTTVPETTQPPDPVQELLEDMTLEERVGQLLLARCDSETALQDIGQYHLGGLVLFSQDFEAENPDTLREKLDGYQAAARIPLLLAVDEEGGTVTRISRYPAFRDTPFSSPRDAFSLGGMEGAVNLEAEKCQLLSSLHINVNLGPVCDISTNPGAFMYRRSLGQDPQTTAQYVSEAVDMMDVFKIGSVLKHFPGYGNNADTHTGIAVDSRSLEELEENDLIPFAGGIAAGCDAVLVSHTIVQALDDSLPASLSPAVHRYLRENMGFDGVIVTDDLVMEAITDLYGAGEAAVLAVLAGNDLLCVTDYALQYEAILAAVQDGRIRIDAVDQSVARILAWKQKLGLIR